MVAGKVYVQVFIAGRASQVRNDIYIIEGDGYRLAYATQNIEGQILGVKPNGEVVTRNVSVSAARNVITSKVP